VAIGRAPWLPSREWCSPTEPTGNLDPKTSELIWDLFLRLQAERHLAFVIATKQSRSARKATGAIGSSRGAPSPGPERTCKGKLGCRLGHRAQLLCPTAQAKRKRYGPEDLQVYFARSRRGPAGEPLTRDSEDSKCSRDLRRGARRVIILAREEAGRFRHDFVGTEAYPPWPDP